MRATNDGKPTGAVGTLMSYISQPWAPPEWAQDEFIDILTEKYAGNIKHTWGGAAINGLTGIFDHYSTSEQSAVGTYQAWILFGDPSMMLRTKTPQAMTVTHQGTIVPVATSYTVNVENGNGALATITNANHDILGSATVSNGTATIDIGSTNQLVQNEQLTLCVFGYNKVTYLGTITVTSGVQHNITCNQPEHGSISVPEQAYEGVPVTLAATPETGYFLSSWEVEDADNNPVTVDGNTFFMPQSDVTVSATFEKGLTVSMASVMNGSISADPSCLLQGTTVNLTATPAAGYVIDKWVVFKTGDVNTTVTVNDNSFTMPDYDVTVSAIFMPQQSDDVTIGSVTSTNAYIPTYSYYKYSLTQQIYTAAEVGDAATITAVAFKVSNEKSATRTLDIYLSHTTKSSFSGTDDWVAQSTDHKVYSGSVTFASSGWTTITLDTPFEYDGTSNLLLTIDDNTGSDVGSSSNSPKFYVYSTGNNTAIYKYNDDTNYNPASMTTAGTQLYINNQVIFTKKVPIAEEYLSVSPSVLSGFSYAEGNGPSEVQSVAVIGAKLLYDVTVTMPTGYEVSSDGTTYASSLSLTPANFTLQQMLYVRLAANQSQGNYSGSMTLTSDNVTQNITLNGEVIALPTIELAVDDSQMNVNEKNAAIIIANQGVMANVILNGRTLWKDSEWNTLCLPFAMTAEQVTAQLAPDSLMTLSSTTFSNGTLTINFEDATTIDAGKPYIILWNGDGTNNLVNPEFTGVTLNQAMTSVETEYADFVGCISSVAFTANDRTKLFLSDGNALYYPNADMTIRSCTGYFVLKGITAGDLPGNAREFRLNFGDATGIAASPYPSPEGKGTASRLLQEGTGEAVDLFGRRINGIPTAKGFYIVNGKKIVIK